MIIDSCICMSECHEKENERRVVAVIVVSRKVLMLTWLAIDRDETHTDVWWGA